MRDTTVLRRLIAVAGVSVVRAELTPAGLVAEVRLATRKLHCPYCDFVTRSAYDRRAPRLWRHLDLGGVRCHLRLAPRRLRCPAHGVVTEGVPFADPRSGHTYAFEDEVAWLAQRADKTTISRLLRLSWRSVGRILARWMARHRPAADPLAGLRRIAIDEKSWRKGHQYVTAVADHDAPRPRVVWMGEGRSENTLRGFFTALGPERSQKLVAASTDIATWYLGPIQEAAPQAALCFDPFHVVQLANRAVDQVRRREWNRARREGADARAIKHTRWALLKHPARLSAKQRRVLAVVRRSNRRLWRAYELKEIVRQVFSAEGRADAAAWLDGAIRGALRSRLHPFRVLGETLRQHREGILNAVRHGLSNSPLEALNGRLALLSRRASGFHSAQAFIALAMLCVGGYEPTLPHQ